MISSPLTWWCWFWNCNMALSSPLNPRVWWWAPCWPEWCLVNCCLVLWRITLAGNGCLWPRRGSRSSAVWCLPYAGTARLEGPSPCLCSWPCVVSSWAVAWVGNIHFLQRQLGGVEKEQKMPWLFDYWEIRKRGMVSSVVVMVPWSLEEIYFCLMDAGLVFSIWCNCEKL